MPAALATSAVGVPWKPRSAQAWLAASTSVSRRSSAVESVLGVTRSEYALTHTLLSSARPRELGAHHPVPHAVGHQLALGDHQVGRRRHAHADARLVEGLLDRLGHGVGPA